MGSKGLLRLGNWSKTKLSFTCNPGTSDFDRTCDSSVVQAQGRFAPLACCEAMLSPSGSENRLSLYSALFPLSADFVPWPPRATPDDIVVQVPPLPRAKCDDAVCNVVPELHWMVSAASPRAQRVLQLVLVHRRVHNRKTTWTRRLILNGEDVARQFGDFARGHGMSYKALYMEDLSIADQIVVIANTDVLVAMHGFDYCFFHHCLAHETIWIQAIDEHHDANRSEPFSKRNVMAWMSSRKFNPANVLRILDEAMTSTKSWLLTCPSNESVTDGLNLSAWMHKYRRDGGGGIYCPSHTRVQRDQGQGWRCSKIRALANGPILVPDAPLMV